MTLSPSQLAQLAPPLRGMVQQLDAEGLVEGVESIGRTPDAQAAAMAANEAQAPGFIAATYAETPEKAACLAAVEALTAPRDVAAIEAALLGAFAQPGFDIRALSWHILNAEGLAEAIDLRPVGETPLSARARVLIAAAVAGGADKRSKVLTREGRLPRCHIQLA